MIPHRIEMSYVKAIRLNPIHYTPEILDLCDKHGIELIDYGKKEPDISVPECKQIIINANYLASAHPFSLSVPVKDERPDKQLEATYFNILCRGTTIGLSDHLKKRNLDAEQTKNIFRFQLMLLLLSKYGYDQEIVLNTDNPDIRIAVLIANDENHYWLSKLSQLTLDRNLNPNKTIIRFSRESKLSISIDPQIQTPSNHAIVIRETNTEIDVRNDVWFERRIDYSIMPQDPNHVAILTEFLHYIFGFKSFRDGQIEIIANYLNGNSTIGILPTSGGKSLTFYMCILLQPVMSIIIAPINSLIIDQHRKLTEEFKIDSVAMLIGDNRQFDLDLERFETGKVLFTYASPERIQMFSFRSHLIHLGSSGSIGTIVLDEVHCLSEWGHDFRISYLMLAHTLNRHCKDIRFLGLTATASLAVLKDLMIELSIEKQNIIYLKKLKRNNLSFGFRTFSSYSNAQTDLQKFIQTHYKTGDLYDIALSNRETQAILVFCQTKKNKHKIGVENLYESFLENYPNETTYYHGDEKRYQMDFTNNRKTLMFATKAFGMGIDKDNIRATVHFGMTSSRESFYQEAGRAGRDGKHSSCYLFSIEPESEHKKKKIQAALSIKATPEEISKHIVDLSEYDISTALFFHRTQFKKAEFEAEEITALYRTLLDRMLEGKTKLNLDKIRASGYCDMVLTDYQDTCSRAGNPMWVLKLLAPDNRNYPLYLSKGKAYTKKLIGELRAIASIDPDASEKDLFTHLISNRIPMKVWLEIKQNRPEIDPFKPIIGSKEILTNQSDIEKSLYVLHKIGIVRDWTKEYNETGESIHVELNEKNKDINHIKENAKEYLCSYEGTDHDNEYVQNIDAIDSMEQFYDLILQIRLWYHSTFITLKREQIANMYSLIERFKNQDKSNEIQSLIEDYFDISGYIGKVGESFLDFEDKTFVDVVSSAFDRDQETLEKVKLQIERKLESFVDLKTDVFAGIIHLRSNSYLTDRNGKQRFEEALKKMSRSDIMQISQRILDGYESFPLESRLNYINTIKKYDEDMIGKAYDTYQSCPIIKGLMCVEINRLLKEVWL